MIDVDIQWQLEAPVWMPPEQEIQDWVEAAVAGGVNVDESVAPMGVSILITGIEEITRLNHDYRQKNQPTNVLSFPLEAMAEDNRLLLGDIAISLPVVEQEAEEQGKTARAHFAHLVVHGVLHLLGYDHTEPADAAEMEPLETEILSTLGFENPYDPG
ncbi:MAG: rRNA maturation RNase YbeY [Pseudomonadales bacterium]|nr:rRNA maturation RNase YbeY [Pseudomonadales bacterium]